MTPDQQAVFHQALALHQAGRVAEARDLYRRLLEEAPDIPEVLAMLGAAECQMGRPAAGLGHFDAALVLRPDQPNVLQNRGNALAGLGRFEAAVDSYERALRLRPDHADIWYSRGNALQAMGRNDAALESYDHALRLRPDHIDAHNNRGNALQAMARPEAALDSYTQVLSLRPDHADALNNRGNALQGLRRIGEAVSDYERALAVKPDFPWLPGHALHLRMQIALWNDFADRRDALNTRILRGEAVAAPMHALALADQPEVHLQAARTFAALRYPAQSLLPSLTRPRREGRIRIGYFSTDFKDHPVSHLIAGVLEHHDRTRFEVFAFALESEVRDTWRARVEGAVEHFIDAAALSDVEVTGMARKLGLDIAIDLNGFTRGHRTAIFAERAAPVQASYLGYLGSMGADYYDYLIADETMVPEDKRAFYVEKIAALPCFQVNDDWSADGPVTTRSAQGLPETGFVFCAFNQTYKITPDVFDGWMRILARVPDSVLWIYAENAEAVAHLTAEAGRRNIPAQRLVFAGRLSFVDHLARLPLADLFLDTFPYNAGATASGALRKGVPILTRLGQSFPARMGASLLTTVGLTDLITETPEAYENLAVTLATDAPRMAAIKAKLAANLPESILFDTSRATRALEALFEAMHDRAARGLPPEHIDGTPNAQ